MNATQRPNLSMTAESFREALSRLQVFNQRFSNLAELITGEPTRGEAGAPAGGDESVLARLGDTAHTLHVEISEAYNTLERLCDALGAPPLIEAGTATALKGNGPISPVTVAKEHYRY